MSVETFNSCYIFMCLFKIKKLVKICLISLLFLNLVVNSRSFILCVEFSILLIRTLYYRYLELMSKALLLFNLNKHLMNWSMSEIFQIWASYAIETSWKQKDVFIYRLPFLNVFGGYLQSLIIFLSVKLRKRQRYDFLYDLIKRDVL